MIGAFRKEAVRRGLLPKATPLTPKTASALVRDMPYKGVKSRSPGAITSEWQGTCSGNR